MDLQFIKKWSILTAIWSLLFIAIIITNVINKAATIYAWLFYATLIGIAFTSLKIWNKSLQEPLLDINLTYLETFMSISLAILVAIFGGVLMQLEIMKTTLWCLLLAFVMTTSQFSLLKVSPLKYHILVDLSYSSKSNLLTLKNEQLFFFVCFLECSTRSSIAHSWIQQSCISIKTYLFLYTSFHIISLRGLH